MSAEEMKESWIGGNLLSVVKYLKDMQAMSGQAEPEEVADHFCVAGNKDVS